MSEWFDFTTKEACQPGHPIVKAINGHPIALFNLNGEYYAIEDSCPHQGLPLSDGPVLGNEIICPYHGARFCIKTGEVTAPPAYEDLPTFEVRIIEGMIQVKV
ncbi:Rieske 2Fe-2S domain-containing protein [Candidatus Berkiella aquae]|uniref:Naphthalene 1,2-dioxygenase/salicylate 5-hydroxylase system, ferredoxin component n=1 Tax=Candidatus Berkiella aquae TaxID=295108 RepID=A0A0Q9YWN0_9GAMM|nr:non-heme iron oxygenase ferredoxin subunit [Candidatus Berkiella aquae]MCS5710894.1 non-heme iron oxygenase ferredoxin subunit [Candidatus Berkiella aquae]